MTTPIAVANWNALADSDLVQSALAGRESGFEELVRRYQRPIAAYVYRMVGDYDAALDLTQEVFIKVYASLARYRSEFKFSTWIYKIAHNAAIDHLRRHATREPVASSESDRLEVTIESRRLSPEQGKRTHRTLFRDRDGGAVASGALSRTDFAQALAGFELRGDCRSHGIAVGHCEEPSVSRARSDA
jgi:DNA-directed RNA polymerase specialized sigma24 family protein